MGLCAIGAPCAIKLIGQVTFFRGTSFGYAAFDKRKPARLRAMSFCALTYQCVIAKRRSLRLGLMHSGCVEGHIAVELLEVETWATSGIACKLMILAVLIIIPA